MGIESKSDSPGSGHADLSAKEDEVIEDIWTTADTLYEAFLLEEIENDCREQGHISREMAADKTGSLRLGVDFEPRGSEIVAYFSYITVKNFCHVEDSWFEICTKRELVLNEDDRSYKLEISEHSDDREGGKIYSEPRESSQNGKSGLGNDANGCHVVREAKPRSVEEDSAHDEEDETLQLLIFYKQFKKFASMAIAAAGT